ncbi:ATP-binding protein [Streptomyces sp. B15]|uniref:ATP-binding protein n=1 Tax=Streptomyces sp. B15 TaxID=1537797 RepID=UPI001B361AA3|nr:ATP-binding protein [Streptomyces sp. B15]MBQ1122218.1 ATP-binding protein [Streptomyces sp. B15]
MDGVAAKIWATDGPEYLFELEYQAQCLPQVRSLVCKWLHARGLDVLAMDAALIATELCSNLRHTPDRWGEVSLRHLPGGLRLAVRDRSTVLPVVPATAPCVTATGGRGLYVAAASADKFEIEPLSAGGKIIWGELFANASARAER